MRLLTHAQLCSRKFKYIQLETFLKFLTNLGNNKLCNVFKHYLHKKEAVPRFISREELVNNCFLQYQI